ncbi:hypothetical protein [Bradyrhizobium sp. I1.7.5]|uniref:hypothetical protein n=1 Tax=Bradyrhizobium sp. I1.7.5 TaxID=3156363 RepID=UPI00339A0891
MTLEQIKSRMHCREEDFDMTQHFESAVWRILRSSSAEKIGACIAKGTHLFGHCAISHNELADAARCSRRNVGKAIRKLIDAEFLSYHGKAADGSPIYRAIWERAKVHRKWDESYCEAYHEARAANTKFVAPAYPGWDPKNVTKAA